MNILQHTVILILNVVSKMKTSESASTMNLYVKEVAPYQIILDNFTISALSVWNKEECALMCHQRTDCGAFLYGQLAGDEVVNGCYENDDIYSYTGQRNKTVGGLTCHDWSQNYSHVHYYTNELENYCRDPDFSGFLWCYTTHPNRWLKCDIPKCYHGTNCRLIRNPVPTGQDDQPGFIFYRQA